MDFFKFLDIIDKQQLFFPSADQLEDPFEGSYPKASVTFIKENIEKFFSREYLDKHKISRDNTIKAMRTTTRLFRSCVHISCWHMSDDESDAFWKLYCSNNEGIAIQTTISSLISSLEKENQDVFIGKVKYIDYLRESIPLKGSDFLKPFLYKRISFQHEREVRAIIFPRPFNIGKNMLKKGRKKQYYADIYPDILLENVYVSPTISKWKKELIKSVVSRYQSPLYLYELTDNIYQSTLSKKPFTFK